MLKRTPCYSGPARRLLLALPALLVMTGLAAPVLGDEFAFKRIVLPDDRVMEYALGLPEDLDPEQTYPVLLALPPGPQDHGMVGVALETVGAELRRRGWIVISPVAPGGKLFFQGSEGYLPVLLDHIVETYKVRDRKFHIFGISNGGISAFRLGTLLPIAVASITVAPGYPSPPDFERIAALTDVPVSLIVGEQDGRWVNNAISTNDVLTQLGGNVSLEIVPGSGHGVFRDVGAERLIQAIEKR